MTLLADQSLNGVSIDYAAVAGSAVAGTDFEPVAGTVTRERRLAAAVTGGDGAPYFLTLRLRGVSGAGV